MNPQAWWGVALSMLMLGAAPSSPDGGAEPPSAMERYTLVILKRPANGGAKVADPEALQRQHLAHLAIDERLGALDALVVSFHMPDLQQAARCLHGSDEILDLLDRHADRLLA